MHSIRRDGATHLGSKKREAPQRDEALPTNIEAERRVLGYHMVGGPRRYDVTERDFSLEDHKEIWRAMVATHRAGNRIDMHGIALELGEKKLKLITVGYLIELSVWEDLCGTRRRI